MAGVSTSCSTLIIGAGLTGLSAAYHLEQAGCSDYLLLERDDEVGGLACTETYAGFSFDRAIHVLYTRSPYVADLICNKLLVGNLRKNTRESYCYTAGCYTEFPYQANNYGLPIEIIAENILGLIEAHSSCSKNGSPAHFEDWIYQTFGRGIAEHFMIPYNRRQWAWDLQDMAYDWIADRVPMPEVREVVLGAFNPPRRKYGPNREFWYPITDGIEALPRALLRYIPEEQIWCGAQVVTIDGTRREVMLADGRRIAYQRTISTMPLPTLVEALGKPVPLEIRRCAGGLRHNTVHVVNIGLERTELGMERPAHWVYFPEESTIFHRLSFPHLHSAWMAPPDCSSIQAEISESVNRARDRATLIQETLLGLVRLGILSRHEARPVSQGGRVRMARMVTLSPAYVIYDLTHREKMLRIKEYLKCCAIVARGRFAEWEYLNMDHAILRGKNAAAQIIGNASED